MSVVRFISDDFREALEDVCRVAQELGQANMKHRLADLPLWYVKDTQEEYDELLQAFLAKHGPKNL